MRIEKKIINIPISDRKLGIFPTIISIINANTGSKAKITPIMDGLIFFFCAYNWAENANIVASNTVTNKVKMIILLLYQVISGGSENKLNSPPQKVIVKNWINNIRYKL